MDAGTENVVVEDMQKSFRWYHGDDMAGERSVIVGSSHTNQRIECWCIAAWKDKFCQMEEQGIFSTADGIHVSCVRFCFMQLIQHELDLIRAEWNTHYIRRQTREGTPCGKPDILYLYPELYGTYDYKFPVEEADCECLGDNCDVPSSTGIDEELEGRFLQMMELDGMRMPDTLAEAIDLLTWLISKLD
ncbi:uncharacterized protein LOC128558122 [Mercenaria mercenaria]|uniref:uncharacterized protein LOC128558122 n=1 Tax=Mercenaria mercenaria TaxID=6596 RepID=UPI00234F5B2F|nr:uncharacterized protein LOC128558122 [Mercenaria mercenaria]